MALVAVTFMIFDTIMIFFPTSPQTAADTMNYAVVVLAGVLGEQRDGHLMIILTFAHLFIEWLTNYHGMLQRTGGTLVRVSTTRCILTFALQSGPQPPKISIISPAKV